MTKFLTLSLVVTFCLLGGCDDFPRDPEGTLDTVRGGIMRVGISENPPWTAWDNGRPGGIEARLVEGLADELNAKVEWVPGTESQLMEALARFELDLVVAGLEEESPWADEAGFTKPYVQTTSLVGVPAGTGAPDALEGQQVAVHRGDAIASILREQDAWPLAFDVLPVGKLVAAEDWQIATWHYLPTSFILAEHAHVFAAPPGENGWLARLDRFLSKREAEARTALLGAARP